MNANLHRTRIADTCKQLGISRRLFFMAKQVRQRGCDELVAAVVDGTMSINLALQLCRFDPDSQRLLLNETAGMKPRGRTSFIRMLLADAIMRHGGAV